MTREEMVRALTKHERDQAAKAASPAQATFWRERLDTQLAWIGELPDAELRKRVGIAAIKTGTGAHDCRCDERGDNCACTLMTRDSSSDDAAAGRAEAARYLAKNPNALIDAALGERAAKRRHAHSVESGAFSYQDMVAARRARSEAFARKK